MEIRTNHEYAAYLWKLCLTSLSLHAFMWFYKAEQIELNTVSVTLFKSFYWCIWKWVYNAGTYNQVTVNTMNCYTPFLGRAQFGYISL